MSMGDLPLALEQASQHGSFRKLGFRSKIICDVTRASGMKPDRAGRWVIIRDRRDDLGACLPGIAELGFGSLGAVEDFVSSGSGGIARPFLQRAMANLPVPFSTRFGNASSLDRAVDLLRRFSLLSADEEAVSLHPLVGTLTRERLPAEQQRNWCESDFGDDGRDVPFRSGRPPAGTIFCAQSLPHALGGF